MTAVTALHRLLLWCFATTSPSVVHASYDKIEYAVVYINSESSLLPSTFSSSFPTFSLAFIATIYDTLPGTFNISRSHLWCTPNADDFESDQDASFVAAFYFRIHLDLQAAAAAGNNDVISSIEDHIQNELFWVLFLSNLKLIDAQSALLHPAPVQFETVDTIITSDIAAVMSSSADCVAYLLQKRMLESATNINTTAIYTNTRFAVDNDDDDGDGEVQNQTIATQNTSESSDGDILRIHVHMFIIWSFVCVVIGVLLCSCIVCAHIRFQHCRHKRRQKQLKEERRHRRRLSRQQQQQCTSNVDDEDTGEGLGLGLHVQDSTAMQHQSRSNLVHVAALDDHDQQPPLRASRASQTSLHAQSNRSTSLISKFAVLKKGGYDAIGQCDDEEELKQEEIPLTTEDCEAYISSTHFTHPHLHSHPAMSTMMDVEHNMQLAVPHSHSRRTSQESKQEKIVTVHVHHHYSNNPMQEAQYPELPAEAAQYDINQILSVPGSQKHAYEQKEPSKSQTQKEGIIRQTKQGSSLPSSTFLYEHAELEDASDREESDDDDDSDSEQMYVPGPDENDDDDDNARTPGQCKQKSEKEKNFDDIEHDE